MKKLIIVAMAGFVVWYFFLKKKIVATAKTAPAPATVIAPAPAPVIYTAPEQTLINPEVHAIANIQKMVEVPVIPINQEPITAPIYTPIYLPDPIVGQAPTPYQTEVTNWAQKMVTQAFDTIVSINTIPPSHSMELLVTTSHFYDDNLMSIAKQMDAITDTQANASAQAQAYAEKRKINNGIINDRQMSGDTTYLSDGTYTAWNKADYELGKLQEAQAKIVSNCGIEYKPLSLDFQKRLAIYGQQQSANIYGQLL